MQCAAAAAAAAVICCVGCHYRDTVVYCSVENVTVKLVKRFVDSPHGRAFDVANVAELNENTKP